MKALALTRLVRFSFVSLLAGASSLVVSHAGFVEMLRGEPAPASVVAFQRVAFVGSARVKEVQGQAERLVGIDAWKPLQPGAELAPGDLLRTRNGTVVLRMKESGSYIKVTPQTILRLVEWEKEWDRGSLSGTEDRNGFTVRSCRGKAFVRKPGEEWTNIEVNTVLAAGTEIRTEHGAIVDLFNTRECRPLRIQGGTLVKLHEAAVAGRVQVSPSMVASVRP